MDVLELERVSVALGGERVLAGIDLALAPSEFVVLVGPSGSGKSTLLRAVAGLVDLDDGEIRIDGRRVDALDPGERDLAMVFQSYALYPHKTVAENLAFPLRMRRVPRAEIAERVARTAAALGLAELLERKPAQLSGGQMQRVALGRALIRKPRLFLFDEPLSNLDAKLRGELRGEIARLHASHGIASLYVTHDQAEAMTLGARIAVLERGRIAQVGAPLDVFERPATRFVAGFIGSPPMNLIEGEVHGGRALLGALSVACPHAGRARVVAGFRPHDVVLGELGGAAGAGELRVEAVEALGTQTSLVLDLGGPKLTVSREGRLGVAIGERVRISIEARSVHWFDARSGERLV